ncbi:SDR family NAD(P)-dependent oxidoreductase [Dactylosporangium sp. CA-092794]|uniref:SDR family NAD(P)-dependent oxidoreductase n=1 Tax=Dactylosporangium sp. CA-092794 TaxID=3239929 RepID=UPI003D8ACA05
MELINKTALVTGASGGIGEELARQLAERGAHLVLVARRADALERLRREILAAHPGREVTVIPADLAEADAGREVVDALRAAGRPVDLLVNNAGIGSHGAFAEQDPAAVARLIQLNITSLVDLTGRLLPGMLERGCGGVVNVASTAAFQPVPSMAVYAASKAFVLSFTEALWGETRGTGVRVLTLCPGATETAFFTNTGKEFLTRGRQTPAEVARTALNALDGHAPTAVSGLANRLSSAGYRFLPRAAMIRFSQDAVRATHAA